MNGYEAYKVYQGVRLHFIGDYDYFKYGGKTKTTQEGFERRKDKYLFHKVARLYNDDELHLFFAVNFLKRESSSWINGMLREEAAEVYDEWKAWQMERVVNFTNDLKKISAYIEKNNTSFVNLIRSKDGQFPELLTLQLQGEISLDTLVILDYYMKLMEVWNRKIGEDFIWEEYYKKMKKYAPFFFSYGLFNVPAYEQIIRNNLPLDEK